MIDLAEYALYQCIKEEEHEHKLKSITYFFELLDDCKTCNGVITNYIGEKIKRFSSRPANSVAVDRGSQERTTSFINRSYVIENNYTHSSSAPALEDDRKYDDKWLQPKYDKDNDVLLLMVSV